MNEQNKQALDRSQEDFENFISKHGEHLSSWGAEVTPSESEELLITKPFTGEMPEQYYLHSVGKDGWRKSVQMITQAHLSTKLWVLRNVSLMQWFIVRASDRVIIAQSKDCKFTTKDEG